MAPGGAGEFCRGSRLYEDVGAGKDGAERLDFGYDGNDL